MKVRRSAGLRGATFGDMLVFLATVSLAGALLYPAWRARSFRARVADSIAAVETLATAARAARDRSRSWPSSAPPGETPPELAGVLTSDIVFARADYTLEWTSWAVVDSVEAPTIDPPPTDAPPDSAGPMLEPIVRAIGAITVYSPEDALLAELLAHFADQGSFVLDTTLVLILPERSPPLIPAR